MHHQKSNCGCNHHGFCGQLLSKAGKIRFLQEKLDTLEDRKKEIETLIQELKDE